MWFPPPPPFRLECAQWVAKTFNHTGLKASTKQRSSTEWTPPLEGSYRALNKKNGFTGQKHESCRSKAALVLSSHHRPKWMAMKLAVEVRDLSIAIITRTRLVGSDLNQWEKRKKQWFQIGVPQHAGELWGKTRCAVGFCTSSLK